MFGLTRNHEIESAVRSAVEKIVSDAMADAQSALRLSGQLTKLREELETLRIEKGRKEEEFTRKEREVEHKVGLERKRQEFEIQQAKREATVTLREENLAADRKRFEDQMEFHNKRFTEEVTYLKDMVAKVLERLPTAEIAMEVTGGTGNRAVQRGTRRVGR